MAPPRMTANPKRPSRYRPGKGQDEPSDSEYETEEEQIAPEQTSKSKRAAAAPTTSRVTGAFQEVTLSKRPQTTVAPIIDEDEFETESEDESDEIGSARTSEPARTQVIEQSGREEDEGGVQAESSEAEGDDSEDEESGSGSSSSEDEAPAKLLRPTFVRKGQRAATKTNSTDCAPSANELEARRREKADALVQEQLERNAQLKASAKKAWDDSDNEGIAGVTEAEVDDTDGLDPEAEHAAWKLRELKRVKRAREQIEVAEKERAEIERRRNLSKEERDAEDEAHIAAQQEEREGKGKAGYMQRYFHKGAFFQDSEYAEEAGLKGRDIMGSKFADQGGSREALPEFMQIRDMAKLGRKGRTKYRDLKAEDTGRWGDFGRRNDRRDDQDKGRERFDDTLDERFKPDDDGGRKGPSGANATTVSGERRRDVQSSAPRDAPSGSKDGHASAREGPDNRSASPPRHRNRRGSTDRNRSRSRSPDRDRRRYRSRSRSRDRDRNRRKRSASRGGDDRSLSRSGDRGNRETRVDKRVKVS